MRPRSRVPRGVLVATGAVVLVAVGIAGYLSFGYPPWEAAAMTLLTLTTVGFASSSHLSTGVLVFTAGLAFLGVGLFFVILGLAATAIVEGRVSLFSRSRRMRRRLDELRGHFIVCAYGRVGRSIARELEAGGVPFVVVDSKRLEELAITEGSPLAGRSLQELRGPAVPLLVRHPDGQLIANPARDLQLQPGDVLVVFGEVSDLNPLDRD